MQCIFKTTGDIMSDESRYTKIRIIMKYEGELRRTQKILDKNYNYISNEEFKHAFNIPIIKRNYYIFW